MTQELVSLAWEICIEFLDLVLSPAADYIPIVSPSPGKKSVSTVARKVKKKKNHGENDN